jgi:hypothetical protein
MEYNSDCSSDIHGFCEEILTCNHHQLSVPGHAFQIIAGQDDQLVALGAGWQLDQFPIITGKEELIFRPIE